MAIPDLFANTEFGISEKRKKELTEGFKSTVCIPTGDQIENNGLHVFSHTGAGQGSLYVVEYRMPGIFGGLRAGISCYLNSGNIPFRPAKNILENILEASRAQVLPYMVNQLQAELLPHSNGSTGVIGAIKYVPNTLVGKFRLFNNQELGISWEEMYRRSGLAQVVEMNKVFHSSELLTTVESPLSYTGRGLIDTTDLDIDNTRQALRWFFDNGSSVTLTSRAVGDRQ